MRVKPSPARRPVKFVFATEYALAGSTVMRGVQLSSIAQATPLGEGSVDVVPLSTDLRHADLFLTKGALKVADRDMLSTLRRRGNRLFADPVDEQLADDVAASMDAVVAASRTAAVAYRDRWPRLRIAIVDHHVDPRVAIALGRHRPTFRRARFAYFGEPVNTIRTPAIERLVDVVPVDTSSQSTAWFTRLQFYNAHYAVRLARELDDFKPFLKGFTAAACAANILIQRAESEPHHWLPPEYPYWVERTDEVSILESLRVMAETYDTPTWHLGADMMREIADRTSPRAIGRQLISLFA